MTETLLTLVVAAMTLGAGPLAQGQSLGPPVFEDASVRGAAFETEQPRVSRDYRGTWADSLGNCYATSDRGVQVEIGLYAIGNRRVKRTWAYSDYPAMTVELAAADGRKAETLFLDLSLDGGSSSIRWSGSGRAGRDEQIFVRCPPPASADFDMAPGPSSWTNQADGACEATDFDGFFEAFIMSPMVRVSHMARKAVMVRQKQRQPILPGQYSPPLQKDLSLEGIHSRYLLNETSGAGAAAVNIDVMPIAKGGYRVTWSRAEVDPSGPSAKGQDDAGWLLFARRRGCWTLVEEGRGYL